MDKDILDSKLRYIGFNITSKLSNQFNEKMAPEVLLRENDLELILLEACYEVDSDSRMLSLLFSWGKVHGEYIIANKFLKYYHSLKKTKGDCPWVSAFCAYLVELKLQKFQKGMIKFPHKIWQNQQPQEAGIKMKGAITYLEKLNIYIPNGNIRIREQDAISPLFLLNTNQQYRCRYLYGANFRADIIYAIQIGFENPNRIAKALKISYENVRCIFNDYTTLKKINLI